MAIKTPDILPGEKGYVPKKERTAARKASEKVARKKAGIAERTVGNIVLGGSGFRMGRPLLMPNKDIKYVVWRYGKRIAEIITSNKGTSLEKTTLKFIRLGGIGNYKHLIQDADFQLAWAVREQELLITQDSCYICKKKLSKNAKPNLYHYKMFQKRLDLLEQAETVAPNVVEGKLSVADGWEKFNDLLEEGNRYYMSLKDTALICPMCAKNKNLVT